MSTTEDFANQLNRDLTLNVSGPQNWREISIPETVDAQLLDPIRNGMNPDAFRLAVFLPDRLRASRSRSHDSLTAAEKEQNSEQAESHRMAEEWKRTHNSDGEKIEDEEIDLESLKKIAARTEQTTAANAPEYNEFLGDPNQDAREWLNTIETKLANRQNDDSTRPQWNILRNVIGELPAGAKVCDVDRKVLDYCLKNLVKNQIKGRN
jgi:hypothetical protein